MREFFGSDLFLIGFVFGLVVLFGLDLIWHLVLGIWRDR